MILAFMQFVPDANGHGGAQRSWALLRALCELGEVHLVILQQGALQAGDSQKLAAVERLGAKAAVVHVGEWTSFATRYPFLRKRIASWVDMVRFGSGYAPRLGLRSLRRIAGALPQTDVDVIFAGRLPSAVIAEQLLAAGLLKADRLVVDFDDVQSNFLRRELSAGKGRPAPDKVLFTRLSAGIVEAAEKRIARSWHALSVCSADDKRLVDGLGPSARVFVVPNVVDRQPLPQPRGNGVRLLFVGNMGFGPNMQGLRAFVDQAWPAIRAARPDIRMDVVGFNQPAALVDLLARVGIESHGNAPSVEPFYAEADIVLAPILYGSGTRIKILEALAYQRAVVSTSIGAEGLGMASGFHGILADTMPSFAEAVLRLAGDEGLRHRLSEAGRALQQERYGPGAMSASLKAMIAG